MDASDLCQLCSSNCARCWDKYNNCISCKTGWVLYKQIDSGSAIVNDYCVPGDGVSHYHKEGTVGTTLTDWGKTGAEYKYTYDASVPWLFNPCLHGLMEKAQLASYTPSADSYLWVLITGTIDPLLQDSGAPTADDTRACFAAQCHPSCYTCEAGYESLAWSAIPEARCTSCRTGWYLSLTYASTTVPTFGNCKPCTLLYGRGVLECTYEFPTKCRAILTNPRVLDIYDSSVAA